MKGVFQMATYTMELRNYIEMWSQGENLPQREVIEKGRKQLFDFDYPFFDEAYRGVFETNFIRKFYMKEIGFETEGLFKFQLETWLNINMPYFNKLFESELIEYDPLINSEMKVTHTKTSDTIQENQLDSVMTSKVTGNTDSNVIDTGNVNTSKTDDNFTRDIESNNPDSRLALTANDGEGVIEYASNIKEKNTNNKSNGKSDSKNTSIANTGSEVDSTGNQKDTSKSNINDVEEFIQHRIGKIGVQSYPDLIKKYRASLLRIEVQIFKEMTELFMMIY